MKKNRSAFTMVELVFVILVVGLLASVAIPKAQANRTEAKTTTELHSLATRIQTIANRYTAAGVFDLAETEYIKTDCFTFANSSDENGTIHIAVERNSNTDPFCERAEEQAIKNGLVGEHVLTIGGSLVAF